MNMHGCPMKNLIALVAVYGMRWLLICWLYTRFGS